MPELWLERILDALIPICELMGVTVVIISVAAAFGRYVFSLITRTARDIKFELASGLALSLEFKMAAEILKTVLIRNLTELVVLGAVIVLRGLLSFLIHFEMKQMDSFRGGSDPMKRM